MSKSHRKNVYFRKSFERWHSREKMDVLTEKHDLSISETILKKDGCENETPVHKSQIGLVYLKPVVGYSVTLYFQPREKFNDWICGGSGFKSPKDARYIQFLFSFYAFLSAAYWFVAEISFSVTPLLILHTVSKFQSITDKHANHR